MKLRSLVVAFALAPACAEQRAPDVAPQSREKAAAESAAEPEPEPEPRPAPSAPVDAGGTEEPPHRWLLTLRSAGAPCTLLARAQSFEDAAEHWTVRQIRWLATEESGSCAAGTLFDAAAEQPSADAEPVESLDGGPIAKPGTAGTGFEPPDGGVLADFNFDQHLDLCVKQAFGSYNFSQRCWVFDPATRRFVREAELEELQEIEIDKRSKTLRSSWRIGGPAYVAVEKRWIGGKLVKTRETLTHLGETPQGQPLPDGHSYVVEYQRRGGKLVRVREGTVKN